MRFPVSKVNNKQWKYLPIYEKKLQAIKIILKTETVPWSFIIFKVWNTGFQITYNSYHIALTKPFWAIN